MGGCYFRNIVPFMVPKRYRGKAYFHRWTRKSWGKKKESTDAYWNWIVSKICWYSCSHQWQNSKTYRRKKKQQNQIYVSVDKITQQIAIHLPEDQSVLIIQIADLSHVFGYDLEQNQTGVIMKGKGLHYPQYSYDIIKTHSLMIYSDIMEYKIVGDTKTPLLRCIPFISKVKNGDIISRGQYMTYQSFTNLQFKKFLKNSFHSIKIDIRDTTGEKNHFVSVEITRIFLLFRKISDNHFWLILHTKWLLKFCMNQPAKWLQFPLLKNI